MPARRSATPSGVGTDPTERPSSLLSVAASRRRFGPIPYSRLQSLADRRRRMASTTTTDPGYVTLGVDFGADAAPLVLLVGGTTMLSWPDALCLALPRGDVTSSATTCATQGRQPRSIRRLRRTRCVTLPPMRRHWRVSSTIGQRSWPVPVSAAWSLKWPRSTTPTRSPRSRSVGAARCSRPC